MGKIAEAIRIAYPRAIREHSGAPFKRPTFTDDARLYSSGFYWANEEGDRFYFTTYEAAAEDLAVDIGMSEDEAARVIAAGCAVA